MKTRRFSRHCLPTLALFTFGLAEQTAADAATLNVPSQYPTIQAAVNAAAVGDTVLVANGTYTGEGNRNIDFGGKDLTVKSSGGSANCILDCQSSGRAFYFHSGETTASRVEGFTITHGYKNTPPSSSSPSGDYYGGGILVSSGNATVKNCVLVGNIANTGGGMSGGTAINCIFNGNISPQVNAVIAAKGGFGGGMYGGTAVNCVFFGNRAENGTFDGQGGGINQCTAVNCILWGNQARGGTNVYISNVTYSNVQGGYAGIGNINADPRFVNAANGDFHLTAASPCIDMGTAADVSLPAADADGKPRVVGVAPDMGAYEWGHFNPTTPVVAVLDFNGDRLPDLLTDTNGKPTFGYTQVGQNGVIVPQIGITPDAPTGGWKVAGAGRFAATGTPDLVLVHPTDRRIHLWHMNGTKRTSGEYVYYTNQPDQHMTLPQGASFLGTADFDGDGWDDIAWFDAATRRIGIWSMHGASFYSGAYINQTVPDGWQVVAMGRIDPFPSSPQLVLLSPAREIHLWSLRGFEWYDGAFVFNPNDGSHVVLPAGWNIVGVADMDRDGLGDLVLQNPSQAWLAFWRITPNFGFAGGFGIQIP